MKLKFIKEIRRLFEIRLGKKFMHFNIEYVFSFTKDIYYNTEGIKKIFLIVM